MADDDAAADTLAAGADTLAPATAARPAASGGAPNYQALVAIDPQHYVLGEELARGGMGRIQAARDRRLGRTVAIKELLVTNEELYARFEREVRITAKLQHPGIVSLIEAGTWPSGEPFFAMKLVAGTSLDRVIDARKTLAERLALLPNVIAAVDALAYAHHERVIHRDLKPANVLVGKFGETVVIDWGLAKDLSEPEAAPVRPSRVALGAPQETIEGEVMGTPAYMPAEQALGEVVDERADVYALGALLYHVLTGAPPFTGKTADAVLQQVVADSPVPIRERAPETPADLVAIVGKAMAREPGDRYPSAQELAEDLKKFQTGQLVGARAYTTSELVRRWLRRHRAIVSVAAAAAGLLAVLAIASVVRIRREREAAVANRADAEQLVAFMEDDLRAKLEPVGKLELLETVATKAVAYYEARADSLDGPGQLNRSVAHRHLGDVLSDREDAAGALGEYRTSLALAEQLAVRAPADLAVQANLSRAYVKLADGLTTQRDFAGALTVQRAATAIDEMRVAVERTHGRVEDLADDYDSTGKLLSRQADLAGALAMFRQSRVLRDELAATEPKSRHRQRDLMLSDDSLATTQLALGDAAGALERYRHTLSLAQAAVAEAPDDAERLDDLADSEENVASVLADHGDPRGALELYGESRGMSARMLAGEPANGRWRSRRANTQELIGWIQLDRAPGEALKSFRASFEDRQALAAVDPTNVDSEYDLSRSRQGIAYAELRLGDVAAATSELATNAATRAKLVARDPEVLEWQRALSYAQSGLGECALARGDAAEAVREDDAALAVWRAMVAKTPSNAAWTLELAESVCDSGDAALAAGDVAKAERLFAESTPSLEKLVALDATSVLSQYQLARARFGTAKVLDATHSAAAADAYKSSLALLDQLLARDPENAHYAHTRAEVFAKLAGR